MCYRQSLRHGNQLVIGIREDAGQGCVVSDEPGGSRKYAGSEVSGGSSVPKERLLDSSPSFVDMVGVISEDCQGEKEQEGRTQET